MTYTINSTTRIEDSINTNVTFVWDDGKVITVDVSHFRPGSVADIVTGIINRAESERAKFDAITTCIQVYNDLINGNQNSI